MTRRLRRAERPFVCPCGAAFTSDQATATYCSRACYHRLGARAGGATAHELYGTWENIKARVRKHHRYAGRGISLHEPWLDSATFIAEVERELGPRPPGQTLDRVNNDLGYEPGNLRWATPAQQQHNRGQRGTSKSSSGWVAQITREYRHFYVGSFESEAQAHAAYQEAAVAYRSGGIEQLAHYCAAYRKENQP